MKENELTVKVLGARLLVKEIKNEEKTNGGIIVPGREKEQTNRGVVLATGEGALLDTGVRMPMQINKGDKVVYASFAGSPIEVDGETLLILNERDVLAVYDVVS